MFFGHTDTLIKICIIVINDKSKQNKVDLLILINERNKNEKENDEEDMPNSAALVEETQNMSWFSIAIHSIRNRGEWRCLVIAGEYFATSIKMKARSSRIIRQYPKQCLASFHIRLAKYWDYFYDFGQCHVFLGGFR